MFDSIQRSSSSWRTVASVLLVKSHRSDNKLKTSPLLANRSFYSITQASMTIDENIRKKEWSLPKRDWHEAVRSWSTSKYVPRNLRQTQTACETNRRIRAIKYYRNKWQALSWLQKRWWLGWNDVPKYNLDRRNYILAGFVSIYQYKYNVHWKKAYCWM